MLLNSLLPRPTPLFTLSLCKPKFHSILLHATLVPAIPAAFSSFTPLATRPLLSGSVKSISVTGAVSELPNTVFLDAEEEGDLGARENEIEEVKIEDDEWKRRLPNLSVKEKKEVASYAHSLGKNLKSQQVGKSGVTATVVTALIETLEANELLKLKIHNNCPGELDDVVKQLEKGTGSVAVGQIGRTVILYRPSLTKLKAEEKKKQAQATRIFSRKQPTQGNHQSKAPLSRESARGRRGSSRFSA